MFGTRSKQPFERLHWRLMLAYVVVTSAATLIVGIIVMARLTALFYFTRHSADLWVNRARDAAMQVAGIAGSTPTEANAAQIENWILRTQASARESAAEHTNGRSDTPQFLLSWYLNPEPHNLGITVADRQGRVIASSSNIGIAVGQRLLETSGKGERAILTNALADSSADKLLGMTDQTEQISVAAPIHARDGHVAGVILMRIRTLPNLSNWALGCTSLVICVTIAVACVAIVFGFVFSYFTARWLTRRLHIISTAAASWSAGDFAPRAVEVPRDEVGQLGARLNAMASELSELFALRDNLAAIQERNRIARDLHDTVKQQAFAAALQIGAAQASLTTQPAAAEARLEEAAAIVQGMQHELAGVLKELSGRPDSATAGDLKSELIKRTDTWSRQTQVDVERDIVLESEPQRSIRAALVAITDEALSNVLRHSKAQRVSLRLRTLPDDLVDYAISDDGHGFVLSKANVGMGLRNMRERAESLPGGSFTLVSDHDTGTQITVRCGGKA